MKRLAFLFLLTRCFTTCASEQAVIMEPFHVRPSDLSFYIGYVIKTDAVTEVRVVDVARGSAAERVGIREGDLLISINGIPLVGKKRRSLLGRDGRIVAIGQLKFEGHRGLFRKPWSITVEALSLRDKDEPIPTPQPASPSRGGSP
jgi:membrane-associated protease RseP (regulator of RpoE activity)